MKNCGLGFIYVVEFLNFLHHCVNYFHLSISGLNKFTWVLVLPESWIFSSWGWMNEHLESVQVDCRLFTVCLGAVSAGESAVATTYRQGQATGYPLPAAAAGRASWQEKHWLVGRDPPDELIRDSACIRLPLHQSLQPAEIMDLYKLSQSWLCLDQVNGFCLSV